MNSIDVTLTLRYYCPFFEKKIKINLIRIIIPEGMANFKIGPPEASFS